MNMLAQTNTTKKKAGHLIKSAFAKLDADNLGLIGNLLDISKKNGTDPFAYWKNSSFKADDLVVFFPSSNSASPEDIAHYMEGFLLSYKKMPSLMPSAAQLLTTKRFLHRVLLDMKTSPTEVMSTSLPAKKRPQDRSSAILCKQTKAGLHIF